VEKSVTIIISMLVLLTAIQIFLIPTTAAQETKDATLFLYGDGLPNGDFRTDTPTSPTPREYNAGPSGGFLFIMRVGTWECEPFTRDVHLEGNFQAIVWAEQIGVSPGRVQFTSQITIDGEQIGIDYQSEDIIITGEEMITFSGYIDLPVNSGEVFGMELWISYLGTSLNVYWASTDYPSHIIVPAEWCSVYANNPSVNQNAKTTTISASVIHALGPNEIVDYILEIEGPSSASTISGPTESISGNVITVTWVWNWGSDNVGEGTYTAIISAIDSCGNIWDDTTSFYISISQPPPPPPPPQKYDWTTITEISNSYNDEEPSLIQDDNDIYWLAFTSYEGSSRDNILVKSSADGVNWGSGIHITQNNSYESRPSLIQDSKGIYWLAFQSSWGGDYDIWICNSTDGYSWSSPRKIIAYDWDNYSPNLIQDSGGTYWITWSHYNRTTYDFDICISSSIDCVQWGPINFVTSDYYWDGYPSMIQDSTGTYRIAWSSDRMGYNDDICLSYSSDPLGTWNSPIQLTNQETRDYSPSLIENVDGGFNLSWRSRINGQYEILYTSSIDWNQWSSPEQVTNTTHPDANKYSPSLIQDSHETLWIAWSSATYDSNIWISNKITNDPPSISIVNLEGEQRGNISIQYTLTDSGSDICSIRPMYSTNNIDYYDAAMGPDGDGIIDLSSSPSGITHTFVWDSSQNVTGIEVSNVLFRIIPCDCQEGEPGVTSAFSLDNNAEPVVEIEPISDIQTGSISFSYTVADNETDRVTIIPQYSLDGETYSYASMGDGSDKINNVKSSVEGKSYVFVWDSKEDLPDSDNPEVIFRIIAKDSEEGIPGTIDAFYLDNKAPLITSGPTISSKTHISATIQWETDEPSDGIVYYGVDRNYGYSEIGNTDSNSHSVTLNLLEPETEYHFYVSSSDHAGNEPTESDDLAFTTEPIPNESPVVLIISLKNGDTVSGKITIHGEASDPDDDGTLEFVEIKIDNDDWKKVDGKKAWKYKLDTKELENGKHDIYARAFDGRNYSKEFSLQIKVDNQDTLTYIWIAMILVGLSCIGVLIVYAVKRGKTQRSNTSPSTDFYQHGPPRDFIPVAEPYTHDSSTIIAAEPVFIEAQPIPLEGEIIY
jgi:hypothetical protein